MAQVLITAIIKYLPRFIKFLIHILKDVLPPFFETIFNTILDAMGVAKDSPLRKIIKPLSKILPWLLAFGLLIGKFLPMIISAVRFLQPVISGLMKFLPHISKLLAGLNPVGIVAIIITAVWIFAEEIVKVYDWIIEKVFGMVFDFFPSLKPFKDVIVTMAKTFFMLTPNIYSLARLFANIKKLGFLKGLKKTIKEFLGSLADIGGGIAGFFLGLSPKQTKATIAKTKELLFGMFDKFISFLKENIFPVWTELINAFSTAFDMFADTFMEVWKEVKVIGKELYNEFSTIFSEIFGIFSEIFGGLFSKDNEKSVGGFKTFFVFFQKILKTSLSFLKPFLKFFSKIFIINFKILVVMIKALIAPFRFFVFIVEKLVKGFSKLKNMFSGGGLTKTISEIGNTVKDMITGAFTKAKTIFEDAMIGLMEMFLGLIDQIGFQFNTVKELTKTTKYGVGIGFEAGATYAEEAKYIRKMARKTGQSEEYLHRIARGEVQTTARDNPELRQFEADIKKMKSLSKGEEQVKYLKKISDALEGKTHASNNININTGGTLTDPSLKNYNSSMVG